jgi:hypothetical protein
MMHADVERKPAEHGDDRGPPEPNGDGAGVRNPERRIIVPRSREPVWKGE